jgi:hypothetical protein
MKSIMIYKASVAQSGAASRPVNPFMAATGISGVIYFNNAPDDGVGYHWIKL